jgi:hypothetical protein
MVVLEVVKFEVGVVLGIVKILDVITVCDLVEVVDKELKFE